MPEHDAASTTQLHLAGNLPWITVVGIATPFMSTLLVLSVLVAALSTVGVFLRFRSASLAEIQLRLAALEDMPRCAWRA